MDIFIFFINFAAGYIQDGILIAIDTDKEYLSDKLAFMNKDI